MSKRRVPVILISISATASLSCEAVHCGKSLAKSWAVDAHQIRGMLLLALSSAAQSSPDISAALLIPAWPGDAWLRLSNPVDAETCHSTWLQGRTQVVSGEIGQSLSHLFCIAIVCWS
jgi:hypothetical protein